MSYLFPDFNIDDVFSEIEQDNDLEYNGTSFLYDFEKGDFVYKKGNPVLATKKEALKVWIEKALRTQIYNYKIYSNIEDDGYLSHREYGSNLFNLILGKKLPNLVIRAEAQRDVEETLAQNPYIKRIENFEFFLDEHNQKSWKAIIKFDVITIFDDEDSRFTMEVGI